MSQKRKVQQAQARKTKKAREMSPEVPEPEPITELMFSIPHGGANTKIPVAVGISWPELQGVFANIFSIPPKDVHVAYRFSTSAQTSGYDHLTNENTLRSLFIEAISAVRILEKSRRQDNDPKRFMVEIKDNREPQKVKKGKKKKPTRTQKRAATKVRIVLVRRNPSHD